MSDETPDLQTKVTPEIDPEIDPETEVLPSPLRCWSGTMVAGGMSYVAFLLTQNVVASFASKPATGNQLALQIASTVRTLVMGVFTMATGVFGVIAVGLFLLGVKSLLSDNEPPETSESN